MKRVLLLLISVGFLVSACQTEPRFLSDEQMAKEKKAVVETIKAYNLASEHKNFGEMVETLAGEVRFFGTDSGEVISSFAQYKEAMLNQWKEYDVTRYGDLYDIYVEIDPNANLASIIYGVPCYVKKGDYETTYNMRVARTLKKENDKWNIVSGINSIQRSTVPEKEMKPIDSLAAKKTTKK